MTSMLLHDAIEIAVSAHESVDRKYINVPYIAHPMSVMMRVRDVTDDPQMLAAAILHDVLEGCPRIQTEWYAERILDKCGIEVLTLVEELTDHWTSENFPKLNREVRKRKEADDWEHKSDRAQTIKLADLLDNTSSSVDHAPGFARVYMQEKAYLLTKLTRGNAQLHLQADRTVREYFNFQRNKMNFTS